MTTKTKNIETILRKLDKYCEKLTFPLFDLDKRRELQIGFGLTLGILEDAHKEVETLKND